MAMPPFDRSYEPAPSGRRVRIATVVAAVLALCVSFGALMLASRAKADERAPLALASLALPLVLALSWTGARIHGYRLEGGRLVVHRRFLTRRFPLDQVVSAEIAENVMRGAWKIYGNDGLGAVAGSYRSRRWGGFNAYLTDTSVAVVLHLRNKRCIIVSPADQQSFLEDVRARIT